MVKYLETTVVARDFMTVVMSKTKKEIFRIFKNYSQNSGTIVATIPFCTTMYNHCTTIDTTVVSMQKHYY